MLLTSRERIIKTLKREKTDRVPICLYEFDGIYESWIHNYPEYEEILQHAEGKTDKFFHWSPVSCNDVFFFGKFDSKNIKIRSWDEGKSRFTRYTYVTPKGEITSLYRNDESIHTTWCLEHLCKNREDAEKILSIPYIPAEYSVNNYFELDKKIGDRGIVIGDIGDALCHIPDLFGFSNFMMVYLDEPELIFRLLDFFQERLIGYLEQILNKGAKTLYRICGSEYATPPYFSPADFEKLVFNYDRKLIDILHKHGAYARIHSHGKVKKILNYLKEMNADATDPIEPPPDGDVEISEAREILGDNVILFGNIEERLFEIGTKEDIKREVKKTLESWKKAGNFVLCPTAMPLNTPLDTKISDNIKCYIDYGYEFGKY